MKDYCLFLKTTAGRGYFNIFISTTFLVGYGTPLLGWALCVLFLLVGLFFVVIGHCTVSIYDNADFNSREVASAAAKKAADTAVENRHLLDDSQTKA